MCFYSVFPKRILERMYIDIFGGVVRSEEFLAGRNAKAAFTRVVGIVGTIVPITCGRFEFCLGNVCIHGNYRSWVFSISSRTASPER